MDPEPTFLLISFIQDINYWLLLSIAILFILLITSALISGAEVAFFSLSKSDLDRAAESEASVQRMVVSLLESPQKLLATILISNNFVNILIVLIFAYIGDEVFSEISSYLVKFGIEVVLVTFLILLFGEVLPKVYATRNSLKFAAFMAFPLKVLNSLLTVISTPLMSLTNIIENRLGKKQSNLSVEKLSQALDLTSDEATTEDEQKILKGIVSFGNTETSQIMIPRIDIFALSSTELYPEVVSKIVKKGYSRIPVYKESLDDISGILYVKDLIPHIDTPEYSWLHRSSYLCFGKLPIMWNHNVLRVTLMFENYCVNM